MCRKGTLFHITVPISKCIGMREFQEQPWLRQNKLFCFFLKYGQNGLQNRTGCAESMYKKYNIDGPKLHLWLKFSVCLALTTIAYVSICLN